MRKIYYYNSDDIWETLAVDLTPYSADPLTQIVEDFSINTTKYPIALSSTIIDNFWQRVVARYYDEYYFRIVKKDTIETPTEAEITNAWTHWILRFLNFVAQTYDYYNTLISEYATAKANLMADIKATSKNKVKFNDTPQNANTGDTYEGDNYITHFTKTEGETSSPLMTPIMRLKEIQDHYEDAMEDWVNKASKLFIEEANV